MTLVAKVKSAKVANFLKYCLKPKLWANVDLDAYLKIHHPMVYFKRKYSQCSLVSFIKVLRKG